MTDRNDTRILWITERYPPLKGGMAVSCDRQVQGLRRRDCATVSMFDLVRSEVGSSSVRQKKGASTDLGDVGGVGS